MCRVLYIVEEELEAVEIDPLLFTASNLPSAVYHTLESSILR